MYVKLIYFMAGGNISTVCRNVSIHEPLADLAKFFGADEVEILSVNYN